MIRLIASDLDGTLLQPDGTLPPEAFDVIRSLRKKEILFCPASGRQYANLYRLFAPVADEICYICENGAYVLAEGKAHASAIPSSISMPLIHDILDTGMQVLLSLPDTSVMLSSASRSFTDDIFYRLKNTCTIVSDPSIYANRYIKISGFHQYGVASLAPSLQAKWQPFLHADIAGEKWLDFTLTNKGDGIHIISQALQIPTCDIVAFGDQFNDLSMLRAVGQPYLMTNAPDGLKNLGFSPCENVMNVLKSFL